MSELTRRHFLQRTAMLGAACVGANMIGGLVACSDPTDTTKHATLDLGTEAGALNFVYAILQLEGDFYSRVNNFLYPGALVTESMSFLDFQNEVVAARNNLMATQRTKRITDIVLFQLGQVVDFANRAATLSAAQTIEDAAAEGMLAAISYLHTPEIVTTITGYATQAAARSDGIRDMLGVPHLTITAQSPATVMETLAPYYLTTFSVIHV